VEDTRPKVYITRLLPNDMMAYILPHFRCAYWNDRDQPVPRSVLLQEVRDADGVLSLVTDKIDREVFEAAPNLRVVSNIAVGYDNIDIGEAKQRNIIVCNTPDVLTESTADLTFALMLNTARRVIEAASFLQENKWNSWGLMLLAGQDVYGKVLGIIGFGRIGEAVARRARGFGMKIIYFSRQRKHLQEEELEIQYRDLEGLLRESDFVCVLTPLTKETYHMIGTKELSWMKESAILINTSRGDVVDEEALLHALRAHQILAAGLDVYSNEPVRADHPLVQLPNVVALPHIGSATVETRMQMAKLAVDNLRLALAGEEPKYRVNG